MGKMDAHPGRASLRAPRRRAPVLRLAFALLLAAAWAHAAPSGALKQVFKDSAPAVVRINVLDTSGKTLSFGSGFVVSPSGVIVTNHHVIKPQPGARLSVKLPSGDAYDDVWVIHDDERRDFAVLLVKAAGLPTVRLGDSNKVEVADEVVAIGNPKGLELTFTLGIVSAVRPMPGKDYRFIQHQAPISKGSSGGPLLNMRGEVIGINTFYFEGGQNLNGAVPVNYVKAYLNDPPKMTYAEYARSRGAPPQVAKVEPPALPAAWKTYRNETHRFSFKYPGDWDLDEKKGLPWTPLWILVMAPMLKDGRWQILPYHFYTYVLLPQQSEFFKQGGRLNVNNPQESAKAAHDMYAKLWNVMPGYREISTKLLHGAGYAGFYTFYNLGPKKEVVQASFQIITKSRVYTVSGYCVCGTDSSDYASFKNMLDEVVKSFRFGN